MKRTIIFVLLLATCRMSLSAQGETQRYEQFRKQIRKDYRGFRESVLNDYDKFLSGIWVEYKKFAGETPKPARQPVMASSVPDVASQEIVPAVVEEVLASLSAQLGGKDRLDALEALLHFVQSAFRYAADEEQFGHEKPFFFEETLYYPMCDCEDRAVFFAWLVRELLHLDCHLVDYQGHVSTAVAIDGVSGYYYIYKGKAYYMADPTFIDAKVGRAMLAYRDVKPQLLIW